MLKKSDPVRFLVLNKRNAASGDENDIRVEREREEQSYPAGRSLVKRRQESEPAFDLGLLRSCC